MRIPTFSRQRGLRFNLTPMIDVIFNLIIFFLAASHLARSEAVEQVELPLATTSKPEADERFQRLSITVTAELTYYVAAQPYTLPEVEQLLVTLSAGGDRGGRKPVEVRIRTDKRVPYQHIEPLMLACARQGITKIRFAVLPEGAKE